MAPAHGLRRGDGLLRPHRTKIEKGTLLALHLGRMKDESTLRPEQISFGKLNNVREAIKIAREARTILGGNGVTLDYPVMRLGNNLESVLTY
jgi:glutaryl-CoA dehydrogenase